MSGLELAGVALPRMEIVSPATPMDVGDLTFSSYLSHSSLISIFSRSIFDRMAARVSAEAARMPTRRNIYVWRADTRARVMRNEDELVERLVQRLGVQPVVLSTLTLDEQILLFKGAQVVIGPHGAGLANIVFCRPNTVLYELIPHHYINPVVNHLAQLRGMHYWCDVHRAETRPDLWRHQTPWTVDIEAVERRVEEILSFHRLS